MTISAPTSRTAYDDLATPAELRADCLAAGGVLDLAVPSRATAERPAPALRLEAERSTKEIDMLAAARLLAHALNLESDD